jgi:hypothetical protein
MNPIPTPKPVSPKAILILFSHLLLGLPSCFFPSGFGTKIVYKFLISDVRATGILIFRTVARLKIKIYKTNFTCCLNGCETWTLTLREEHRLRVSENRVLRRIFGPKRDEVAGRGEICLMGNSIVCTLQQIF